MKLVAILALTVVVLAACGDDDPTNPDIECTSSASKVCIPGFEFDPEDLSVANGASVTWENADAITHTSTSNPNNPAACPDWDHTMASDQSSASVSFTPGTAVTCEYYCKLHATPTTGGMRGSVVVQ
jgi:plastocyanin